MFKPYPQSQRLFAPLNGIQDLKKRLIRYRIQICCILAVVIVSFAVFILPKDNNNSTDISNNLSISEIQDSKIDEKNINKQNLNKDLNKKLKSHPKMVSSDLLTSKYVPDLSNLIILPCHSIFAPELNENKPNYDPIEAIEDSNNWLLESFQLETNDHLSFFKHIELAFNELHHNIHNSVLIISGGFTKDKIEKSESLSYYEVAKQSGLTKNPYFSFGTNILLEEFARDSYENILYSLARFYKKYNKFPRTITIIGFGFKKERFLSSHLTTLGYYYLPILSNNNNELNLNDLPNTKHVKYISAGPILPPKSKDLSDDEYQNFKSLFWKKLYQNEKSNALDLFKENPFGSKGSILNNKKLKRDHWNKHIEALNYYKSDNHTLNTLLEIDDYEIIDAWKLFKTDVLPNYPIYEKN